MIKRVLATAVLALVSGAMLERAQANQLFVCDDGKTISVTSEGLADAIRHDPCVARYFGRQATPRNVPMPEPSPLRLARDAADPNVSPIAELIVRSTGTSGSRHRSVGRQSVTAPQHQAAFANIKRVKLVKPKAYTVMDQRLSRHKSGTYRRVYVLNATRNAKWFHHNR